MASGDPYYVYTLSDPRDGEVFYVGKGMRNRAFQHATDVREGKVINQAKTARIRAILKARKEPKVSFIQHFDDEADAVALETSLIRSLPNLTNIATEGYLSPLNPQSKGYLHRWLKRVEKWPGVTFPDMPNGDAEAERFVEDVRALIALDPTA